MTLTPTPDTAPQIADMFLPFVEKNYGVRMHFSPASLAQADTIIDDLRQDQRFEDVQPLLFAIGCYLGEVFVRHAHGVWRRSAELRMPDVSSPIVIQLRDGRGCNPVARVYRRFQLGPAESLAEFYRTSVAAADERLAK